MDHEFLYEYEAKEKEDYFEWIKSIKSGKEITYPGIIKYGELKQPVGEISYNNIWSVVPIFQTVMVPIFPIKEPNFFERSHGFKISDIPSIAQFSSDTKRIRFYLVTAATSYEGLDFFDPIFQLNPHSIPIMPPDFFFTDVEDLKEIETEFDVLARINFYRDLAQNLQLQGSTTIDIQRRIKDYQYDYSMLHALGYSEVIENLQDLIVNETQFAAEFLNVLHHFLINPKVISYERTPVWDLDIFKFTKEKFEKYNIKIENTYIPYEIGKYIMKKISLYPESFTACEHICEVYEQHDYYQLVQALFQGINDKKYDAINSSSQELSLVLDNIWKDAENIKRKSKYINYGFTIGFAALGTVAAGPVGLAGGLLASFGLTAGTEIVKSKSGTLYEQIAKKISKGNLSIIFDFNKKYNIK